MSSSETITEFFFRPEDHSAGSIRTVRRVRALGQQKYVDIEVHVPGQPIVRLPRRLARDVVRALSDGVEEADKNYEAICREMGVEVDIPPGQKPPRSGGTGSS